MAHDMKHVTHNEITQLLDQEIKWCLEHPANNLNSDFQKGFMSGLQQAVNLINGAFEALEKDV